jgi:uncharacterized membrane protein YccC
MYKPQSPAVGTGSRPRSSGRRKHHQGRTRALRPLQPAIDRRVALSRLLALWPHELDDDSAEARVRILGRLRKALRAERRRGLAGHWTYDLARHIELLRLYRAELADLAEQLGGASTAVLRFTGPRIG